MLVLESDVDIMAALKCGTAEQHKEVERLMPFFDEHLSRQTYIRILGAFLGIYEPLERKLDSLHGWSSVGLDLAERRRAHLLRADLLALGQSEAEVRQLPRCEDLPPIDSCVDGLGVLYVLEGSTLGGQLIAREVHAKLGIDERSGAAFFQSRGNSVGKMWMEFCAVVRRHVDSSSKRAAVLNAAESTFIKFGGWMRKAGTNGQ
jgi:heme oxygenase